MDIVILCNSSTGFCERYAKYLAGKTGARLVPYSQRKNLGKADVLIYGSHMVASNIAGLSWFKKVRGNYKYSFVFACGAMPEKSTPGDYFYLPGGIAYEKLSLPVRFMLKKVVASILKDRPEDAEMAKSSYSLYDEKYVPPLLDELKKQNLI